jgi:hypothetical protein
MSIANAIGAGLAIAGALAALAAFLWQSEEPADVSTYVHNRTARRVRTTTAFSAVVTPIGAVLLLSLSAWGWAVGAFVAAVVAFYALQAHRVHGHWRGLRNQFENASGGRVPLALLVAIGTYDVPSDAPPVTLVLPESPQIDYARDIVVERSTVGWALRHPLGGVPPPLYELDTAIDL